MEEEGAVIQEAARLLRQARHAVVFTGAGISTPSGVPDFQSHGTGLWRRFDPMEVASIDVFRRNPEKFYGWLRPLLGQIWTAKPNVAHATLARLEAAGIVKALITQNIDDLHQRAGSKNIYEVHGSLRSMTCPRCRAVYSAVDFREALASDNALPRCLKCQSVLKPDIVLYGEMLPAATWMGAEEHCRRADVILVAGSSLTVYPAASLPEIALESGARLIINNRTPTPLDETADVLIRADVADALPEIDRLAR